MSLRSLSLGCAGILILLGCWAVFEAVRSLRKRQWRGVFFALVSLCLFAFAVAPVSYLAGVGAPHAIHNKPALVPDSLVTYYIFGVSGGLGTANSQPTQLFAVRARTGAILWKQTLPYKSSYVEAGGDTVYGVSGYGYTGTEVFALDSATGATRWRRTVDGEPAERAPLLVGDALLLGIKTPGAPVTVTVTATATPSYPTPTPTTTAGATATAEILALRPTDGQELWRDSLGPTSLNYLPIVGGANVFYDLPNNSTVEARSLSDGHLLWAKAVVKGIFLAGPDPVFTLSYDGTITALNAADGTTRWSFGDHETFGSVALSGGTLFVAEQQSDIATYSSDNPQTVYALDAASGAVRWRFSTHSPAPAQLYASGDTVYVSGGTGFYALRTMDGSTRWHMGSTNNWDISPYTPNVGSTLYITQAEELRPDNIGLFVPVKEQMYISALDTRDGSVCWSVPVGPEFAFPTHL